MSSPGDDGGGHRPDHTLTQTVSINWARSIRSLHPEPEGSRQFTSPHYDCHDKFQFKVLKVSQIELDEKSWWIDLLCPRR